MSTAQAIVGAYLSVGVASASAVLWRKRAESWRARAPVAALAVVLWPFLLPTLAPGEPLARLPAGPRDGHGARIDALALSLQEGWARTSAFEERERRLVEAFVARLRAQAVRLAELEATLPQAPPGVRGKLAELRTTAVAELDRGLALLEELSAQLVLLRFVGRGETGSPTQGAASLAERVHVEELIARIESLAEVSRADARPS